MTRKWVKEELRKNFVQELILKIVNYSRSHKNEVITGIAALAVAALFIGLMIRNRIQQNMEAGRIFAAAQSDFESFRYENAAERLKNLLQQYPGAPAADMAAYLKGLSYYRMEDYEKAREVLNEAALQMRRGTVINHIRLALAKTNEQLELYREALEQYEKIEEDNYLHPEALLSRAGILEIKENKDMAVELYRKAASEYPHLFWGEAAAGRLQALGVDEHMPPLRQEGAGPPE